MAIPDVEILAVRSLAIWGAKIRYPFWYFALYLVKSGLSYYFRPTSLIAVIYWLRPEAPCRDCFATGRGSCRSVKSPDLAALIYCPAVLQQNGHAHEHVYLLRFIWRKMEIIGLSEISKVRMSAADIWLEELQYQLHRVHKFFVYDPSDVSLWQRYVVRFAILAPSKAT